ncbi:hypothetical protein [Streptomyces collinus]|uniref:hypothetical protein n=1 Tax=Streptomyces collinus TaxID=42684 RepID=UPI0036A5CA04
MPITAPRGLSSGLNRRFTDYFTFVDTCTTSCDGSARRYHLLLGLLTRGAAWARSGRTLPLSSLVGRPGTAR